MSQEQRRAVEAMLRDGPLDLGGDVQQQRAVFEQMMSATPLPDDVVTESAQLGGVPVVNVSIRGTEATGVILYVHGGAYAIGSAALSAGLASDLARASGTRAVSVEYRLAPEHPYPAGLEDVLAAYRGLVDSGVAPASIVFAGESAGGGLVAAALVALAAAGLPYPAGAYLASPWADLSLTGESLATKADVDPSLTPDGLRRRAQDYLAGADPEQGAVSAVFADLAGLPPMLIQVGGDEVLLSDSLRLASAAALAGVDVALEVTAGVPHVFVSFSAVLDEASAAIRHAGDFIGARLAG